jgi:hypothetical protein
MTTSQTSRNVRRTTWILAAVAAAFYVGFILRGVMQAA